MGSSFRARRPARSLPFDSIARHGAAVGGYRVYYGVFAISGNKFIVNPRGPGVASAGSAIASSGLTQLGRHYPAGQGCVNGVPAS
jgi:hypothetical protein